MKTRIKRSAGLQAVPLNRQDLYCSFDQAMLYHKTSPGFEAHMFSHKHDLLYHKIRRIRREIK